MVLDMDGHERWLTPNQHRVLLATRSVSSASMAAIAASLGFATSTVSRALVRLASMGLVAYDTRRGRGGGVTFLRLAGKALEQRAQAAWMKLKQARIRARERWTQRLLLTGYPGWALNVATIESSAQHLAVGRPWTVEELREAGF
jgi:DNA-binding MarR family transcriptional regulator